MVVLWLLQYAANLLFAFLHIRWLNMLREVDATQKVARSDF